MGVFRGEISSENSMELLILRAKERRVSKDEKTEGSDKLNPLGTVF